MTSWIRYRLQSASWLAAGGWLIAMIAYASWVFKPGSAWANALSAGRGLLPETQPGFPAIEPARSLSLLGEYASDYMVFQALDVPYAILNVMLFSTLIALGIKALNAENSVVRWTLSLPLVYALAEAVENPILVYYAAVGQGFPEALVLVQQTATTTKLASFSLSALAGFVLLASGAVRKLSSKKTGTEPDQ